MPNQPVNLVADFVLSMLPKDYLEALRILTRMNFPLNDRSSFLSQVKTASDKMKESGVGVRRLLSNTLGNLDFPIQTPQGAMEKFHARAVGDLGVDEPSRPFPLFPELTIVDPRPFYEYLENPRIESPQVRFYEVYGSKCGEIAYQTYLVHLRLGTPEPAARALGMIRGDICQANLP